MWCTGAGGSNVLPTCVGSFRKQRPVAKQVQELIVQERRSHCYKYALYIPRIRPLQPATFLDVTVS